MKRAFVLFLFSFLVTTFAFAQSPYGYKGKRTYLTGDLTGSLRVLAHNEEGKLFSPPVNVMPEISLRHVYNKRNELGLSVKLYNDVATMTYNGTAWWSYSDYSFEEDSLDKQAFRTTDISVEHFWYRSGTNAPLGKYFGIGIGAAFSSFNDSIHIRSTDPQFGFNNGPNLSDTTFQLTGPVVSPMLRFHFGNRQLLSNRIFIQYGMSIGLNLAYIGDALVYDSLINLVGLELSKNTDETDPTRYENMAKKSIQSRVFYKNLLNFKLGVGILLF
ncbi:hypothetical protein KFE98_04130 [bacterium SCSIO 12741]|nr:hypothetical protein KFE98_04130 [bacterium SCSIO 12741]